MKIKYLSIVLLLLLTAISLNSYGQEMSASEPTIIGQWVTHDERAVIEIYKEGDNYFGKIDSLIMGNADEHLLGVIVLSDFTLRRKKYVGGTMYDPTSNGTFKSKLWLEDNNTLKVRDYCGLMYHTFTWKRIR